MKAVNKFLEDKREILNICSFTVLVHDLYSINPNEVYRNVASIYYPVYSSGQMKGL